MGIVNLTHPAPVAFTAPHMQAGGLALSAPVEHLTPLMSAPTIAPFTPAAPGVLPTFHSMPMLNPNMAANLAAAANQQQGGEVMGPYGWYNPNNPYDPNNPNNPLGVGGGYGGGGYYGGGGDGGGFAFDSGDDGSDDFADDGNWGQGAVDFSSLDYDDGSGDPDLDASADEMMGDILPAHPPTQRRSSWSPRALYDRGFEDVNAHR